MSLNEAFTKADTKESRESLLAQAFDDFRLAGHEFDTAGVVEDKKSLHKFVRENREHYWVDHYNRGLGFMKADEKTQKASNPEVAVVEFELARLISPTNPKAYSQGAVALISLGRRDEAMQVVKDGLVVAPGNEDLEKLLNTIYQSAAEDYLQRAQENKDPAKAAEAEGLVDLLLERQGEDANLYFLRGVLRSTRGSALMAAEPPQEEEAKTAFHGAAEDFTKAASLVPAEKDKQFHQDALFNRVQATVTAGEYDAAIASAKDYIAVNFAEPAVWKFMSLSLIEKQDQDQGVAALMISKSLEGGAIADTPEKIQATVQGAAEDAGAALSQHGPPELICGYQEPSSGNQIQTWFWPAKRTAMSFILGKKNGEFTW
jgi:tetratricopeptide (TPR) repeat protein